MRSITTSKQEQARVNAALCLALFAFLISAILSTATAQPCRCLNGGYTSSVYQNQVIASNVQFTQNPSAKFDGTMLHCKMDIWSPAGDNCNKRPAIIWVHGGGFAQMDKSAPDVVAMCDSFSRKGFILNEPEFTKISINIAKQISINIILDIYGYWLILMDIETANPNSISIFAPPLITAMITGELRALLMKIP